MHKGSKGTSWMQIISVVSCARRWTANLLVGLTSIGTRMYTECTRVPTGLLECIYSVVAVAYIKLRFPVIVQAYQVTTRPKTPTANSGETMRNPWRSNACGHHTTDDALHLCFNPNTWGTVTKYIKALSANPAISARFQYCQMVQNEFLSQPIGSVPVHCKRHHAVQG